MSATSRRRLGFTLVELLVVITIIGMLISLLMPALANVRETMRQTECRSNLRQIGLAMINLETSQGRLPGYVQPVERDGPAGKRYVRWDFNSASTGQASSFYTSTAGFTAADRAQSRVSWAAVLLPKMDRNDIWDRIVDGTINPNGGPITELVRAIEIYICPSDYVARSSSDNAALSFVVPSGGWDWTEPPATAFLSGSNAGDTLNNGLFHNLTDGRMTSNLRAHDGASTTLMLSENIHKDTDYSWFGVGSQIPEQYFGMVWVVNATPFGGTPTTNNHQVAFSKEHPSAAITSSRPWYARPASSHPAGAFNVVFVDGHARSLLPDIDYVVYQQLMTPHGRRSVNPVDWSDVPAGGAIETFRNAPPLSDRGLGD